MSPIYKIYNIIYYGIILEEISAVNKKNVWEYVRDEYKGKEKRIVVADGELAGLIICGTYIMKYFDVQLKKIM